MCSSPSTHCEVAAKVPLSKTERGAMVATARGVKVRLHLHIPRHHCGSLRTPAVFVDHVRHEAHGRCAAARTRYRRCCSRAADVGDAGPGPAAGREHGGLEIGAARAARVIGRAAERSVIWNGYIFEKVFHLVPEPRQRIAKLMQTAR